MITLKKLTLLCAMVAGSVNLAVAGIDSSTMTPEEIEAAKKQEGEFFAPASNESDETNISSTLNPESDRQELDDEDNEENLLDDKTHNQSSKSNELEDQAKSKPNLFSYLIEQCIKASTSFLDGIVNTSGKQATGDMVSGATNLVGQVAKRLYTSALESGKLVSGVIVVPFLAYNTVKQVYKAYTDKEQRTSHVLRSGTYALAATLAAVAYVGFLQDFKQSLSVTSTAQ